MSINKDDLLKYLSQKLNNIIISKNIDNTIKYFYIINPTAYLFIQNFINNTNININRKYVSELLNKYLFTYSALPFDFIIKDNIIIGINLMFSIPYIDINHLQDIKLIIEEYKKLNNINE
jgi:hypothetical protein